MSPLVILRLRNARAPWPSAMRAAAVALVILFIPVPSPAGAQVIRGQVVDSASGAGVPLARVVVSGVGHRFTRRMFTSADGRFSFPVRRGSFRVQVVRAGYAETRTGTLTVGPDETVDVHLRVSAAPHRLEPVTATARPRRLKVVGLFHETTDTVIDRARVVGESRGVRVRGSFTVPHLCHHLSGNADRRGSVITLTIQARARSELCEAGTGAFYYNVTARRLPPGSYTLRVLHTFQGEGREPVTVLDTTVAVP